MPARHFDRHRARAVRRAADILQSEVAAELGVSDSAVANWEAGHSSPDPEKLPAYAAALRGDLDELFPRTGLPDLADLRCDAGIYQYETAEVIGTNSAGPVAGAERGDRLLKDKYVPPLAAKYGVSEAELRRAEDRSMAAAEARKNGTAAEPGAQEAAAEFNGPPGSLAEKITLILQRSYPGPQGPPSDAEMAADVNAHAGAAIITEAGFADLRTGVTDTAPPAVLDALATVVGVSRMYFEPDEAVAAQVYEGLQLLAAAKKGAVGRVRARGLGSRGLPPKAMALVNELVAELEEKEAETGK
ncbi:helix-turn-helix transcriptional regulator [Streptomyces sp. DG2A-72]|uniref:helix-turn-helix domain-containing protein n=1 Tax=Streptomyces sp. DG2A-72 TaxID=3051386 RepID=UPI00265BA286|nr:helix-turn-helix transcriptional regulator [Streptomyces sp. DG2A-72]MDO0936518.1 helix-turn-helix transcriptional regulator [Streptomyces sp. DG2A-72]